MCEFAHMSLNTLTRMFRKALQQATPSRVQLADETGLHRNTLGKADRVAAPTYKTTLRFIQWLRQHSKALDERATKLEAELERAYPTQYRQDQERGRVPAPVRRTTPRRKQR